MKKFITKFLINSIILGGILSVFFFTNTHKAHAACTVNSAVFDTLGIQPETNGKMPSTWYNDATPPQVNLVVNYIGCQNVISTIAVTAYTNTAIEDNLPEINDMEIKIPSNDYTSTISLRAGETYCGSGSFLGVGGIGSCDYYIYISTPSQNFSTKSALAKHLKYSCDGLCNKSWSFGSAPISDKNTGTCIVKSVKFTPSGQQASTWFKDSQKPDTAIEIQTKGCEGQQIGFDLVGKDAFFGFDVSVPELAKVFNIDPVNTDATTGNNLIKLNLKAGETKCKNISGGMDCQYYAEIDPPGALNIYSTENTPISNLSYECDTFCDENWTFLSIKGLTPEGDSISGTDNNSNNNASGDGKTYAKGVYPLLAPIQVGNQKIETFNVLGANAFSDYLKFIFRLLIGLAGLLSVIMIVVGGIQYMSTDAIYDKEEGKERAWQAVLGLILALGAWLILNTINPEVLSLKLSIQNESVSGVNTPGSSNGGGGGKLDNNTTCPTVDHPEPATYSGGDFTAPANYKSGVQTNLTDLQTQFGLLKTAIEAKGGHITLNDAFRLIDKQAHFYEISQLRKQLYSNSGALGQTCPNTYNYVNTEVSKHGLNCNSTDFSCVVAAPLCSAPHVSGYAVDINITGLDTSAITSGSNDVKQHKAADAIAANVAGLKLRFKALPNDPVHWELNSHLSPYTPSDNSCIPAV